MDKNDLEKFLNQDVPDFVGKNVYVWGMGHTAELYLKGFERIEKFIIKAFCDKNKSKKYFGKWSVIDVKDVISDPNAFVLICTWQKKVLLEIEEYLESKNIPYMNCDELIFKLYREQIIENYECLEDEISKNTYTELLIHRMQNILPPDTIITDSHYFSIPQMKRYGKEIFVDCGAYVGDTLEQYIWQKPTFEKIYAFEPDLKSFNAMKIRVKRLNSEWAFENDKIKLFNCGVGKQSMKASFSGSSGIGSSFIPDAKEGECVDIVALDDVISDAVSIIVADIEGYEFDMIQGAERIIKTYKPTIAVCIYHNAMDLFSIQKLLHSMVPEYMFSIRHCSVTFDETILFAYTHEAIGWVL